MKKGKIFGIINIIDLLIVVVVIGVIAGIFVRFGLTSNKGGFGNSATFDFVVKVNNVRDFSVQGIEKRGDVFAEKTNVKTGEIIDVKVEPCMDDEITIDGNRKFFERPDRYTAYVTVRADGTEHGGAYYDADKEEVGIGRESKICTKHISTNGVIISMTAVE